MRAITPPRNDDTSATRVEIENEPMQRAAHVVSVFEKIEDALPAEGYARTRRDLFDAAVADSTSTPKAAAGARKQITPPRDECVKRVLKEQTPERNANVVRESDKSDDALPNSAHIKEARAKFASGGGSSSRQKSIERSGISIEGELAEKGIAKSRLALFSDLASAGTPPSSSHVDIDSDIIKSATGIAKDRLSLFKNLEQQQQQQPQRISPTRGGVAETSSSAHRKPPPQLKEFTPPPQLDHPHRQYVIVNKDEQPTGDETDHKTSADDTTTGAGEFVPEAGLAKSRMKQYLESASTSSNAPSGGVDQEVKGAAKSLMAKWKSMENVIKEGGVATKDANGSPNGGEPSTATRRSRATRAFSKDRQAGGSGSASGSSGNASNATSEDCLPQTGTARSLLNKWQNIDKAADEASKERRGPRAITPPPPNADGSETRQQDDTKQQPQQQQHVHDDELAMIGKGYARSALAK